MAKTIADYSNDYYAAKASGDAAGMKAANDAANAIRASSGQAAEYAGDDISNVASSTISNYSNAYYAAREAGDTAGMQAANAAANAIRAALGQTAEYADDDIAYIAGLANKSKTPVTTTATAARANNYGVTPTTASLRGLSLADTYGLTYDYATILDKLNNATTASYATKEQEAKQTENQFYNKMVDTQSSALDTLRRAQAAAVATGASKGMAAANELSAVLGLQQTMAPEATALANNRENISSQKQASLEKNASTALDTSNGVKQAIAGIDSTLYGYDTQKGVSILDYLASLANTDATMYSSDNTLEGVKYNADQNTESAKITAAANEAVAKLNASKSSSYTNNSGSTSSGSSSSSGSSGSGTTATESATTTNEPTYKIPNSNDYMKQQSDGSYLYYTTNDQGKEVPTTITAAQANIVKNEGTLDALKPGYATEQVGLFVEGGTVNNDTPLVVGDVVWNWDSENKVWRHGDYTATTKILKAQLEAIEAQKAAAAAANPVTPQPWEIPWDKQTPTMG